VHRLQRTGQSEEGSGDKEGENSRGGGGQAETSLSGKKTDRRLADQEKPKKKVEWDLGGGGTLGANYSALLMGAGHDFKKKVRQSKSVFQTESTKEVGKRKTNQGTFVCGRRDRKDS